jgi:hypothetical protein
MQWGSHTNLNNININNKEDEIKYDLKQKVIYNYV